MNYKQESSTKNINDRNMSMPHIEDETREVKKNSKSKRMFGNEKQRNKTKMGTRKSITKEDGQGIKLDLLKYNEGQKDTSKKIFQT